MDLLAKSKLVNHPFMFQEADTNPLVTDESIITSSAKMMVLDRLLTKLKYAKTSPTSPVKEPYITSPQKNSC